MKHHFILYNIPHISQLSNEKNSHTLTRTHKDFTNFNEF